MIYPAFKCFCLGLVLLGLAPLSAKAAAPLPQDTRKAVVLAYMRIGEDDLQEASLSTEKFLEHIKILEQDAYTVLPLPEILRALNDNTALPPRTLALTFDGAYRSSLVNAFPVLLEKNIPFTVFFSSNALDQASPDSLLWDELKTLAGHKQVTLGVLPAAYDHTSHKSKQAMTADLNKARQRFRENFNREADLLAYPYGEYSNTLKTLAQTQGFQAAFGLQAGALYNGADSFSLPRFSMTERYGDRERFEMIANALPLPVSDLVPDDPFLQDQNSEWYSGFTLPEALAKESENLSCFLSGIGPAQTQKIGTRIEIRSPINTPEQTRMRMNCTLKGPNAEDDTPQWRWFGMLYHRKNPSAAEESENAQANPQEPDEPQAPQE
jgi:peptidoglycan/xylan/chitin deacetylase (PgdA/CDA1 family)